MAFSAMPLHNLLIRLIIPQASSHALLLLNFVDETKVYNLETFRLYSTGGAFDLYGFKQILQCDF